MRRAVALAVALAALALPAGAAAGPVDDLYDDCQDGRIDKRYPKAVLREALEDLPADGDQYTNCRELIKDARDGRRGGGGAGPGSTHEDGDGYGALPVGEGGLPLGPDGRPIDPRGIASPRERFVLDAARRGADLPTRAVGVAPGAHAADLPGPVVALLALLGALACGAAAARGGRAMVRARRG